ncbi:hypothetical protein SteCoe_31042 [Stentor coeruleus]|uniref:Chorein N-terminal domain-containing protein n=1 Tax=Stentor coeruleus TaxID=5963 RepID=A0A1R2B269_9CILI|nr:hypothetical protein SteCoe_31042 [Stentor coeruleus]
MVLKSTIYNLLKTYLAEYLYGFSEDQLEIEVLSGLIELVNVNFKPAKVNELLMKKGQPIFLKCGLIGKLSIKYNYKNILSNPVEVVINELLVVFGPILIDSNQEFDGNYDKGDDGEKDKHWDTHSEPENTDKFTLIDSNYTQRTSRMRNSYKNVEEIMRKQPSNYGGYLRDLNMSKDLLPKEQGMIEKYFKTIFRNLTLIIETMHIKYEDETYPYKHPFSLTLLIDSLEIKPASAEWSFDDTHELITQSLSKKSSAINGKINSFSLHVNSMSSMLIPTSLWEATLSSEIGIFEAFPACDVRDIILEEGKSLVTDKIHHLISPLNIEFCFTISPEEPFYRFSCVCDRVFITISSAMGECLQNFKDYTQNVKIWKKIRKYRPQKRLEGRIMVSIEEKKQIARSWLHYAYLFARLKTCNNHDEILSSFEAQNKSEDHLNPSDFDPDKSCELINYSGEMPDVDEANPFSINIENAKSSISPDISTPMRSSIFIPKPSKTPGKSDRSLGQIIKAYNNTLSTTDIDNIKASAKPYNPNPNPNPLIPKILEFISFGFKCAGVSILLFDEGFKVKSETKMDNVYIKLLTNDTEICGSLNISLIISCVESSERAVKVLEIGRPIDKSPRKRQAGENAIDLEVKFRPGEKKSEDGQMPDLNMFEVVGRFSDTRIQYSHQGFADLMLIIGSFKMNKYIREFSDLDYIRRIEKKKSTLTWKEKFFKKQRQVIHHSVLKKLIMTKKLIRKILQWQLKFKSYLKEVDKNIQPILFDCRVETGGIILELLDEEFNPTSNLFFPRGIIELFKNKEYSKFNLFGFGVMTRQPLKHFYKYLADISEITKGIKKMRKKKK